MKYFTTMGKASRRATDCVIIGVYNRGKLGAGASDIDTASKRYIQDLIKSGDISSTPGRVTLLNKVPGVKARRVAVAGLGKAGSLDAIGFKKAVAVSVRSLLDSKSKQILNTLTLETVKDCDPYHLARHSVEAVGDALYRFDQMKSGRKKAPMPLNTVGHSIAKRGDAAKSERGAKHGDAIANGVALAKDLGNLPANVCTPNYLAKTAKKMASGNGKLTTRVLN
ncbi:MAG: M17 family peptidase N-terminal domain-containing protein, partial [Woeseiaceae bacterium]|nr:M17 family peptidase N-terminal domain-containing protein [Woeseiaceae bacterium]